MNRSRRSGLLRPMAAFLCALVLCASARAQVLQQVPDDALLIVKVKNLQAVSTKVAALADQFGVTKMKPEFADPLGALVNLTGIKQGLDKGGDAALVMLNGDLKAPEPSLLVLVPITNYQAFLGNFANAKKDGEFDAVKFKSPDGQEETEQTYVADWGKYAALADNKEFLKKGPGITPTAAAAKELDTKDVTAYVNFKVLGPKLLPKLKEGKGKMLDDITAAMQQNPGANPKYVPVFRALMGQYLAVAEEFLTDAQSSVFSINLSNEGITTSLVGEFAPGSYIATMAQGLHNTDASLTTGLPEGKYIFFGGMHIDAKTFMKVMDDMVAPIVAELGKTGDDTKPITAMLTTMRDTIAVEETATMGMIAPTGGLGQSPLVQMLSVVTGDAKKIADAEKQMMDSQQQLMALFGAGAGPKVTTTYTANAKTIAGVSFNQSIVKFEANGQTPEAMQMQQMMTFMYGPNGINGLTGIVDDHHLVNGMGVEDEVLDAAVKAIKANEDPLGKSATVAAVNKNLPGSHIAVFYFSVDTLALTIADYARKMGMPIPLNLKPNLPPIGVAIAAEGTSIRVDSYISADMVANVVAAAMQLQMKMQNGGGAGGPGGL